MFKKYVKPYTRDIIINAIIKIAGNMFEVTLPAIMAYMIDKLLPQKDRTAVLIAGLIMVLFSLFSWIGNITANRMASRTSSRIVKAIRHDLFSRAMNLSARQIDRFTISSLETRLTTDTYNIHTFLGVSLRMGIRSTMLFMGGVIFCLVLDWRLTLVLLFMVPLIFLLIRSVFNGVFSKFRSLQAKVDDMVQIIRENIRGIRVSKAMDKTEYEMGRYAERNEAVRAAEIDVTDHMSILGPAVNTILFSGQAAVIAFGAILAMNGEVEAGVITAFLTYFIQIANSLMAMNRMIDIYSRARTSADRISEILNAPLDENQIIHEPRVDVLPEASPEVPDIEFKNVTFSYDGANSEGSEIKNVSFKLYPGETLGIMGTTGAGKSTIIRLLLRLYDPQEGEILLRGVNIKQIPAKVLHEIFGIVLQNDFVFGGTIENNIKFGRELDDEEIFEATEYAQAQEFISAKDEGLDHKLASRGVNLSGGQKQRVLLSRALAGNPEVIILDDSSSALDFATDAKLRKALSENFTSTTSFIIAQRVSSVMHAEQIIVMEFGKILAKGTHEELLETCPSYKEIAEMQLGGGDVDFDSLFTLKEEK